MLSTLTLYGTVALALLLMFEKLRVNNPRVYQSRREVDPERSLEPLPPGVLKWLPVLLSLDESEVFRVAGMDAYMVSNL